MKKQSSKEPKILALAFAAVGVLCCCMGGFGIWGMNRMGNQVQSVSSNNDPTAVAAVQDQIASFDTPPGYNVNGFSMLMYDTIYLFPEIPDGRPTITLMQYKNSFVVVNRQQKEQTLRQVIQQQNTQRGLSMQVVKTFETTIREETVTVTVSEGGTEGYELRQWTTIFDGNGGLVLILAQGSVEDWDDLLMEEFYESIE